MIYSLVIQPGAEEDLEEIYRFIYQDFPLAADTWIDGCVEAMQTLRTLPRRCPVAAESRYFARPVRQLLYRSHRILYTTTRTEVHVLAVRARSALPYELPPLDA